MTNWRDRLRPGLTLISPDGQQFDAKWRKSPRTASKKLGLFEYPGVVGTVAQDLGLTSFDWPMVFFFDGADHDLTADKCMKAMAQTGLWNITHPIYGFKGLQLVSITEEMDPIERGNISRFSSQWLEPIDPNTLKTAAEMSNAIGIQSNLIAISAADQFVAALSVLSALDKFSISNAINKVNASINSVLGPMISATTAVQTEMDAIQRGIQDTMASAILKPLALAGQLQALVQTPLLAINDIKQRLSNYADLASALFNIQPPDDGTGVNSQGVNTAAVQQITLVSTITANALIASTNPTDGGLVSQSQAILSADLINTQYQAIVANLDESQVIFDDAGIETQHVSQELSHFDSAIVTAQAIEYLFTASYDLKKERRFKIDYPRSPTEIAITEYEGPGENDANIDLFIESNDLNGDDILLLPGGREVLIYA